MGGWWGNFSGVIFCDILSSTIWCIILAYKESKNIWEASYYWYLPFENKLLIFILYLYKYTSIFLSLFPHSTPHSGPILPYEYIPHLSSTLSPYLHSQSPTHIF